MADEDEPRDPEESVREAVERSRSGAPAVGRVVRDRFSADEVFQRIVAAADEEITSGSRELYFSALAGGFAITITFLLLVSLTTSTDGDPVLSALLYPLGFIYIIIGGYQLYTENTLPPVALTLERIASIPAMLRNWIVVLAGNFTGGLLGALALAWGGVLSDEGAVTAVELGQKGLEATPGELFAKAAFAGLIVAGVVWVEYGARDTISRVVVIYLAFMAIPVGGLYHVVVSFTEMSYLVVTTNLNPVVGMTDFVLPVLLGNTLGGVVLVTVVNYFQTTEHRLESARFEGADRQLSLTEWVFGGLAGRSYVPLIDTAEAHAGHGSGSERILVPISNPRTERTLVELACTIGEGKTPAVIEFVHVVHLPDAEAAGFRGKRKDRIVAESDELLDGVREVADAYEVDYETSTIVTHRSMEEIFDTAEQEDADLVLMAWEENGIWGSGRTRRPLSELTSTLPCDFVVLADRGLDTERVLVPTTGNAHSDLSAEIASALREVAGFEVTLLHVVEGASDAEAGRTFLETFAAKHGLGDAELIVDESGDVERAIEDAANECGVLLMGATEGGLLTRIGHDTLHLDILTDVECSVMLAERAVGRSFFKRLFGRDRSTERVTSIAERRRSE